MGTRALLGNLVHGGLGGGGAGASLPLEPSTGGPMVQEERDPEESWWWPGEGPGDQE
jgi:hypothetical protein